MRRTIDTAEFEKALNERRAELLSRLSRIEADLDARPNADSEERATERENDEVLEDLGLAGRREVIAIDNALKRIADGTYGICVSCGEPISTERLRAVPYATVCRTCAGGSAAGGGR